MAQPSLILTYHPAEMIQLPCQGRPLWPCQHPRAPKSQRHADQTKWHQWGTAFSICVVPGGNAGTIRDCWGVAAELLPFAGISDITNPKGGKGCEVRLYKTRLACKSGRCLVFAVKNKANRRKTTLG